MIHINNQINAASNLITMIEKTESRDDVFGDVDFRAICDSAKESLMDYIRKVVGNPTDFSRLSQEAQDAIVGAMVGEYESGPPELAESVKDEIRAWAGIPSDNAIAVAPPESATSPKP